MGTMILDLVKSVHLDLGFWGSVASIVGLAGILLNTWRLSKVKRIVEKDRFRIAETMKPFDLHFSLQKVIHVLKQHQNDPFITHQEKDRSAELLKNLADVVSCLRHYFRDVHNIRNIRDNAYVDAGHLFLIKNDPELAEEYYERALVEAKAHHNKKDLSECLQGLKMCSALLGDQEFFGELDKIADELGIPIKSRNSGFASWIERVALKIAFRSQLLVRKNRYRNGRPADASRPIVQIRTHLSQYEVASVEVKAARRTPDHD